MNLVLEMVLKDEGQSLPRTLNSLAPLLADGNSATLAGAVVGIDSASGDDTEKIARTWCERAFGADCHCWEVFNLGEDSISAASSFSRARNAVNDRAKQMFMEDGEVEDCWALILDGHEHIEASTGRMLARMGGAMEMAHVKDGLVLSEVETISFRVRMADEDTASKWAPQPRVHRLNDNNSWTRDVHNILNTTRENCEHIVFESVEVVHDRPESNMLLRAEQRGEAVPEHSLKKLKEDKYDRHANYYLGVWYESQDDAENAVLHYKRCLKKRFNQDKEYRANIMTRIGFILKRSDKARDAKSWFMQALQQAAWMSEPYLGLGLMAQELKEYRQAEKMYNLACQQDRMPTQIFLDDRNYTYMPWVHLADLYNDCERWADAIAAAVKAMEFNPPSSVMEHLSEGVLYFQQKFKQENSISRPDDGKPCIAVFDFVSGFTVPIVEHFKASGWNIALPENGRYHPQIGDWADVNLVYFANENAIKASMERLPGALVVMACGYEQYGSAFQQIDWSNVDAAMFRSEQIRLAAERHIQGRCPTSVVRDAVDVDAFKLQQFTLPDWQAGEHVDFAFVALLSQKKGLGLLIQLMCHLKELGMNYTIHVRGAWQDPMQKSYFEHMLTACDLWGSIVFYPWLDEVTDEQKSEWLQDKHVVLSTSMIESFQIVVAEGMACGLWPLVHHWRGAESTWPEACIWRTPREAVQCLTETARVDNRQWRQFVVESYSRPRELQQIAEVIGQAMQDRPRKEHAFTPKTAEADPGDDPQEPEAGDDEQGDLRDGEPAGGA